MIKLWKTSTFLLVILLLVMVPVALSQDMTEPSITVDGQIVLDDTVRITEVTVDSSAFVVIHSAGEDGSFGDVIGYTHVDRGVSNNVVVDIDTANATDTLFAMLHTDDNTIGEYEFGTVDGADSPLLVNEGLIAPTFNVEILSVNDQFVDEQVVIDSVTLSTDGFIVIHADNNGSPGEVIGVTPAIAGTSINLVVEVEGEATNVIHPMLHVDTDEMDVYEFGTVEGADGPVIIDGAVATQPIWTVPHMRIPDQAIISDRDEMMSNNTLRVNSVLSEDAGFVVIHADNDGNPGEVIGYQAVDAGLTTDFTIELDGIPTPVLYPMLHTDTGVMGEYEFGTVEGADGPVSVDGDVVVFPIDAAPTITYEGTRQGTTLTVEKAVIDTDGWLVIHADNGEGGPGDVIGATRIREGVNFDITVELDADMMTETVFPMLHYDTGEIGTYEFGTVEGADMPVTIDQIPVVGALTPLVIE